MTNDATRAQIYARNVANAMLELRGYVRKTPPRKVIDDVFAEMARSDRFYTACYARGVPPEVTAELIQDEIWNR